LKASENINYKLTQFIKKYYINELFKGTILFISIGLLYFLGTLLLEHFLWLSTGYRTALFWIFIGVELSLLYKFIGIPLFQLFGLKKGITPEYASILIGNHFPEVNDKLTNLLQLQNNKEQSELLLASINQKADNLSPIPFKFAINFIGNKKYIKYLALPLLILLFIQLTGNQYIIKNSYNRVVNHDIAYTPPAPFSFIIKNNKLEVFENQSFNLIVTTKGKVVPEDLKIHFNDESYYLTKTDFNTFSYEFKRVTEPIEFNLHGNNINSLTHKISVIKVPTILNFKMKLDYPIHTAKKNEIISNTGNMTVPEGTNITWSLNTKTTDKVVFIDKDSSDYFLKNKNIFKFNKQVFSALNYQIATSNSAVNNYEKLTYKIQTVKDAYPEINLQSKIDSTNTDIIYFLGKVSDDYGLTKLQLVYNEFGSTISKKENIVISKTNFDQFTYVFPGNLILKKGVPYEYYFEVFDNDKIHKYKKTKSEVYSYKKLTDNELENKQLKNQKNNIDNLSKSLDKLHVQEKQLEEINQLQKEKKELNWNDKNKIKQFIKQQEKQEKLMQKFNQDFQENLEEFQKENEKEDPFKEALKERLDDQEKKLEENEKLLEELKKLQEKLEDEELLEKIEKLSKTTQSQERSLEQILELTKRYYISKKFEKIAKELEKLAEQQEELPKKTDDINTKEAQDKLNNEFKNIQKELDSLQKENNELNTPINLDDKKEAQNEISNDQQKASDKLEKNKKNDAKKNQKNAAEKMKEMSNAMQQQMQSSSKEQMEEDEKMLRQILDNLISYSFDQESLLYDFKNLNNFNFDFPNKLKEQYVLKNHFSHVDDSLFALSLRVPKLSEIINKEISDVHFNIDKALNRFSDQKIYLGVSNQQYALTAANNLANLLSDVLKNMQNEMNQMKMPGAGSCKKPGGSGSGNGQSFQLSDIIKKQEGLMKKIGEGQKPGEGDTSGQEGKNGKSGKNGKTGKDGNKGEPGEKPGNNKGNNADENTSGELYEIYKQQQELKNQFQDLLKKSGIKGDANNLIKMMDAIEDGLLEKGFHNSILKQMNVLKHQLLKLDKAVFEQGEDSKRKSDTNIKEYNNTSNDNIPAIEQYFNEIEILNRQALPLQPIYKRKVQQYFSIPND